MLRYLQLFIGFQKMNYSAFLHYQLDLLAWILGAILDLVISVFCVLMILSVSKTIGGWGSAPIFLLMAVLFISRAVWHTFFNNTVDLGRSIRMGNLDRMLIMPINPLFHFLNKGRYNTELDWEDILVGTYLLVKGISDIGVELSILDTVVLLNALICGGLIYSAVVFIGALMAFWMHRSDSIVSLLRAGEEFAYYPIKIYGKGIQLLMFIIPFAFLNYFPVSCLLYKQDYLLGFLNVPITLFLWIIVIVLWRMGLKSYESTGS
ncbi:MAG: ABC-2 family transporter protein [Desulfobacteraceae bacterium]